MMIGLVYLICYLVQVLPLALALHCYVVNIFGLAIQFGTHAQGRGHDGCFLRSPGKTYSDTCAAADNQHVFCITDQCL